VADLAAALGLTGNAVRQQLATLEGEGLIRRAEMRRGPSRPAQTYVLTTEGELLFSRAYLPLLKALMEVLEVRLGAAEFQASLGEVGKRLAREFPPATGTLTARAEAAGRVLAALGGLPTTEVTSGRVMLRGQGCPLAEVTTRHGAACEAVRSLLAQVTGLAVVTQCEHEGRPRCCFELASQVA